MDASTAPPKKTVLPQFHSVYPSALSSSSSNNPVLEPKKRGRKPKARPVEQAPVSVTSSPGESGESLVDIDSISTSSSSLSSALSLSSIATSPSFSLSSLSPLSSPTSTSSIDIVFDTHQSPRFESIDPSVTLLTPSSTASAGRKRKQSQPPQHKHNPVAQDHHDSVDNNIMLDNFHTTGAFLTRTASKLLGGQSVTGLDSNIHGYSLGRPCKVFGTDKVWYFGTMVGLKNGKIRIRFDDWGSDWDEWLASDSRRLVKSLTPEETEQRNARLATLNEGSTSTTTISATTVVKTSALGVQASAPTIGPNAKGKSVKEAKMPMEPKYKKIKIAPATHTSDTVVRTLGISKMDQQNTASTSALTSTLDPTLIQKQKTTKTTKPPKTPKTPKTPKAPKKKEQELLPSEIPSPTGNETAITSIAVSEATSTVKKKPKTPKNTSKKAGTVAPSSTDLVAAPDAMSATSVATDTHLNMQLETTHAVAKVKKELKRPKKASKTAAQDTLDGDQVSSLVDATFTPGAPGDTVKPKKRPKAKAAEVPISLAALFASPVPTEQTLALASEATIEITTQPDTLSSTESTLSTPPPRSMSATPTLSEENQTTDESKDSESSPDPPVTRTLGNPIDLGLLPLEITEFEYEDESKELMGMIHRVLDTGKIQNRVVEYVPEDDYYDTAGGYRKKKKRPNGDGENGDEEDDEGSKRTQTKTKDKFVAILESRHQQQILKQHISGMPLPSSFPFVPPPPPKKKLTKEQREALAQKCEHAMRNMCHEPMIQLVRQVIYTNSDRVEAINNYNNNYSKSQPKIVDRKERFAQALAGRKLTKLNRGLPLARKIIGPTSFAAAQGLTFNEAGYIETPVTKIIAAAKTIATSTPVKKKRGRKPLSLKAAVASTAGGGTGLDESQAGFGKDGKDGKINPFQSLRSLTQTKKRKIGVAEDHIANLKRLYTPGTRIQARDKQMEWLLARVRDLRNSRVLVQYEGFPAFYNEWIDINSERLKYDTTLEQTPWDPNATSTRNPLTTTTITASHPVSSNDSGTTAPPPTDPEADSVPQDTPEDKALTGKKAIREKKGGVTESTPTDQEKAEESISAEEGPVDDGLDAVEEENAAVVNCIQCQVKISQFRIYCMYCEVESKAVVQSDPPCEPFNLCLWCFSNAFPEHHDHPRSSFATKVIVGPKGVRPVKGGIITRFEKDVLDLEYKEPEKPAAPTLSPEDQLNAMMRLDNDQSYVYLDQWRERKVCAFCNDEGLANKDPFIGPYPFLLASTNRYGDAKKKNFWAHDACARHSPEVIQGKDGTWYNVSMAMRRGRTVKCTLCKEKGATIGCFEPKCYRSFHVPCTGKPMSHFEDGVIFWCPQHEKAYLQRDAYDETFSCDRCSKILGVNPWSTCIKCSDDFFHTFDLCRECFSKDDINHEHGKDDFKITSLELLRSEQLEKEAAMVIPMDEALANKKKPISYKPKMRGLSRLVCSYCWSATSTKWRKGYNGVLMCEDCFSAGPVNDTPMQPPTTLEESLSDQALSNPNLPPLVVGGSGVGFVDTENPKGVGRYATSAEDYSHTPYLTRTSVSAVRFDHSSSQAVYLDSYGPSENQLYSLPIDTTYYDIPGRAPRWATHSGTDYHGTWLPQTVRRAVTKYTNPNDKILSNFLGRGTDAIECFLLGRCCTAVDINPAAITLSIRNCSFAIPPNGTVKAEHRPTILQGDSRKLTGPLFESESFDHVLSHPPYKDCVAYSTHIDGDLSRFGNSIEFQREMTHVVQETYRLLKMGRRCTLGIGDNREHCFYIPVSFQLIRQYINQGFELEELIVKRQRYCAMFGLGTYLCVQFDFLCFTHEFIATLRKVPKQGHDTMILEPDYSLLDLVDVTGTVRAIPSCPIERKSVVMGSVWTFKPTEEFDFPTLCASRMVERFGKNDSNWEEFQIEFKQTIDPNVVSASDDDDTLNDIEDEKEWTEDAVAILPPEEENLVSYERDRLQQIQENNRMLLALGLITELSETSDDIGHQIKLKNSNDNTCFPPPAETVLWLVAHIPCTQMKTHQVPAYRTAIMNLARKALVQLPLTGVFVVGAQDIRTEKGKLLPLGMLILEDIVRVVGDDCLRLKELIEAVPDGYQKDRRKITSWEEYQEEACSPNDQIPKKHLPIVHACYLVFTKVKEPVKP
ncbi:hypothetical protein MVEG_09762 [Podila verticillata NRRL 6337]|nr:hypothetical protein MVEG_09762 [Podila verticillata NRRL 6337]